MKNLTIRKSVFAIALIALPLMSFADGFSFVKLTSKENKMLTLRVGSAQSDLTTIILKNQFGQAVYNETIRNVEGILKNFDLRNLESGHYTVEIENDLTIEVLPISITWDSVKIDRNQFTTLHKPFIKLKENGMVDFNYLNLSTFSTSIVILDNKGNVVYKEDVGESSDIEKRYDISSLEKGEYQFIVQSGGRNFKYSLAL